MDALAENCFQKSSLVQVQTPSEKTASPPTVLALPQTPANSFPFWLRFLLKRAQSCQVSLADETKVNETENGRGAGSVREREGGGKCEVSQRGKQFSGGASGSLVGSCG